MDKPIDTEQHQSWLNEFIVHEDFTIATSPTILLQRLHLHELKATEIIGQYVVNHAILAELASLRDSHSDKLSCLEIIKEWPLRLNWVQFIQTIGRLLEAWLLDYQNGATTDYLFLIARSLTLNNSNDQNVSTLKFQNFLTHSLSSTTHAFDQHRYHFIQHFDIETGLPNQQLLLNTLQQHNLQSPTKNAAQTNQLGILIINLNINFEEASHHSQLLSDMAVNIVNAAITVIKLHLDSKTNLFRLSTQELVVVIQQLKYSSQLQLTAVKLAHAFEEALPLDNLTLILKPFFGGVCSLQQQASPLAIFESAKLALHQAFFNDEQIQVHNKLITNALLHHHQLDEDIINALQENELDLYLQPLVSIDYSHSNINVYCEGGEFLLRWPSSLNSNLSPARLIDTIYKKGFGKIFIRWLINTACRRCAELMDSYKRRFSFTINLSSTDLLDEDLPELMMQSITLWNVPAEQIIIEITETDLLVNEKVVQKVLNEIVNIGFKLALDDFGTGYSSMARLRNMPIHLVKIDQSFVRNIAHSIEDRAIVQSILELAHSLGKEVVAEGVEDIKTLNILKEMQCNKIQGYFYSKPIAFDHFIPWLTEFEASHPKQ